MAEKCHEKHAAKESRRQASNLGVRIFGVISTILLGALSAAACLDVASPTPPSGSDPKSTDDPLVIAPSPIAMPTVDPAPTETPPAPPPPRSPFAYANVDPTDDLIVAPPDPRPTCEADLAAAGIRFHKASLAVHTEGKKHTLTCGAPEVISYLGGPEKISYSSAPLLTCTMALALARLETVIQEEAIRDFGKRVKRIDHLGTYSCREMVNYPGWVSEHSYANAIDLAVFTLEDGRVISVLKDFQKTKTDPTTKNALFLRAISHRAYDEDLFSNVLTEYFDRLHKNHFHLDMSRYRTDGTRPQVE